MSDYTDAGYKDRHDYLTALADETGVDIETVFTLASLLGPSEDFDGLVTSLEDIAYESQRSRGNSLVASLEGKDDDL